MQPAQVSPGDEPGRCGVCGLVRASVRRSPLVLARLAFALAVASTIIEALVGAFGGSNGTLVAALVVTFLVVVLSVAGAFYYRLTVLPDGGEIRAVHRKLSFGWGDLAPPVSHKRFAGILWAWPLGNQPGRPAGDGKVSVPTLTLFEHDIRGAHPLAVAHLRHAIPGGVPGTSGLPTQPD